VRRALLESPPSALSSEVDDLLCRLRAKLRDGAPELRVAVRSSGALEDGSSASFAGQYDSVLNVRGVALDVCKAIAQVWASQWSEHIVAYMQSVVRSGGISCDAEYGGVIVGGVQIPLMAVVIQQQVSIETPP
jgi:hypothetical protein